MFVRILESWHEWGMPQFLKSLTGSFIGKVLGALFIAICFALGVGPDKWANFMIQNLPIWITPNVARGLFLGFGLLTLLAVFRPWEWRKSQRLALAGSVQLPQALSVGHGVSVNILEAKRDTKMHEALAYIESGSWGKKYYEYIATPNSKAKGKSPIIVRQAALDGEIRIWGKLSHYGPHSLIPADYWKIWHIEWFSTLKGESESEIAEIGYSGGEKYYDLMVSRTEIEKKWPSTE